MMSARHRQQGQAMAEALLVLPGLALVLLAIGWLGRLQFSAQMLLQASRMTAMASAAGASNPGQSGFQVQLENVPLRSGADGSNHTLPRAEWLGGEVRLVSATARGAVAGAGPWSVMTLQRRTSVALGAGRASNDADAGRRIAAATTTWRQVADRSQAVARAAGPVAAATDAPWRRAPLALDWLSAWADVVPADRLLPVARAGQ